MAILYPKVYNRVRASDYKEVIEWHDLRGIHIHRVAQLATARANEMELHMLKAQRLRIRQNQRDSFGG